jgi:hypothetical protein
MPAHKQVVIKVLGIDHPNVVTLISYDARGAWVIDKSLALELKALAKEQGLQGFLGTNPAVFVPLPRIEWMMTDSQHIPST